MSFSRPIRSYNIPDPTLCTCSLKSKASSAVDLKHFIGQVLLDVCFKFLNWVSCIGDAVPTIKLRSTFKKAMESQSHHPLVKVRQQSWILIYKMSSANSKHLPSKFQYMPSNRPDIMVMPLWPQRVAAGVTESSLKSWVAIAKQWPHKPQVQQEGIAN